MDRIECMRAFVAVADSKGFALAARRSGVSPSSVTRMVAALEGHLSARLLQRTTRSVSLTDAGSRYLESARRILSEIDEAESSARAGHSEPSGRFAVTAPLAFGRLEVAPLMCELLRLHPKITGELVLSDRNVALVDEGLDAAVRIGHLEDSSLRVRPIGATRRVVVASPSYLGERGTPRSAVDLAGHSTIQVTPLTPFAEWRFPGGGREKRVPIRPSFVTNSADAAVAHAVRGGGLTMVLSYQVADEVRRGALRVVLASLEPAPLPIQIVYPATRAPSANVRAFVDLATRARSWQFLDLRRARG